MSSWITNSGPSHRDDNESSAAAGAGSTECTCTCFAPLVSLCSAFLSRKSSGARDPAKRPPKKKISGVHEHVRTHTLRSRVESKIVDIRSLLLSPDPSRSIGRSYKNLGQLGSGSFGRVFRARNVQTGEERAVKRIPLSGVQDDMKFVHTELEALISLSHPNIVKFYEFFEDAKNLFVVTEICVEGNFKRLNQDITDPTEIKLLFRDLVMAMAYCHDKGVVHRDLKFENCLIQSSPQMRRVTKVIDFGLAAIRQPGDESERWSTGRLGSMYFIAPEVIDNQQNYGVKCDCWAVGVMLYIVLTDEHPCLDSASLKKKEMFRKILTGPIRKGPLLSYEVEAEARDLILQLLVKDPDHRLDAKSCLNHSWFRHAATQGSWSLNAQRNRGWWRPRQDYVNDQMFSRIRSFATYSRFERAMLTLVAHNAMARDVEDLRAAFEQLDTAQNGSLSKAEIRQGIYKTGAELSEDDIDTIFGSLDVDCTGQVKYSDWLAATLQPAHLSSEQAVRQIFTFFDQNHTGKVRKSQLREMLGGNAMVCSAIGTDGDDDDDWLTEEDFASLLSDIAESLENKVNAVPSKPLQQQGTDSIDAFTLSLDTFDW